MAPPSAARDEAHGEGNSGAAGPGNQGGEGSMMDRWAEGFLSSVDPQVKAKILEMANEDSLQLNPNKVPARVFASESNRSLEGIVRALLAEHKGLAKDVTEQDLQQALATFSKVPRRGDDTMSVPAPTSFGTKELGPKDLDCWRRFTNDTRSGLDLRSILEWVTAFQMDHKNMFTEDTLRKHLYILVPKTCLPSLSWKVKRSYPLQKIFDELLLTTNALRSEEEIRAEIEAELANPKDVLAAMRNVLALLETCPGDARDLDKDCLRESQRLIKRIGGARLANAVKSLFLHEPASDYATYYSVVKTNFTEEIKDLTTTRKGRAHHMELDDEDGTGTDPIAKLMRDLADQKASLEKNSAGKIEATGSATKQPPSNMEARLPAWSKTNC